MKAKTITILFVFFLCVWTLSGDLATASIVNITTADGNGADSYVWAAQRNSNYGVNQVVAVKHDTGFPGNNRKGYLRFDLNSVSAQITDAELELVFAGTSPDASANPSTYYVYGLNNGHAGEAWDEFDITWNNAPGNSTESASGVLASDTTYLGSFNVNFNQTAIGDSVFFSSQELIHFLDSATNGLASLILVRDQRNWSIEYFASKENTSGWSAPALELTQVPLSPAWIYLISGLWFIVRKPWYNRNS